MLSYFTPWPVHPDWHIDTVPPGVFTFDFDDRSLHMWTEPLFSDAVLRVGQPNVDTGEGLSFTCFTNSDGLTQFDAVNRLAPFEDGQEIIMRYVLETEAWIAGPGLGHGSQVAVLLADMMSKHRKDQPRRLARDEIAVDAIGSDHAAVHVCLSDGVIRFLHVADQADGEASARRFQVIDAPLDGPYWWQVGGAIVVDERGVQLYQPNVAAGEFSPALTGDDVPGLFHDLAATLWNDGEPLGAPFAL